MKRALFVSLLLVSAVGSWLSLPSHAQSPPERSTHHRLLPRLSTLHQTGGIAGVRLDYRLLGEYDLRRGSEWGATASFENAEIWGSPLFSPLAYVIDVDEILNLEGLKGEALPVAAPFDVYKFSGTTANGSSVELFAAMLGPWMYVRGGTRPPAGGADYFTNDVRWVARSRPFADFNGDGVVDAADYTVMRDSGQINGGAASSDDLTAGASYADWKEQFGERVPDFTAVDAMMGSAAGLGAASAAPEPASLGLVLVVGCFLAAGRCARSCRPQINIRLRSSRGDGGSSNFLKAPSADSGARQPRM